LIWVQFSILLALAATDFGNIVVKIRKSMLSFHQCSFYQR